MYKNQKVQLNSERKATTLKTLEATAQNLQSLNLETPKDNSNHLVPATTKQAPNVLTISETNEKSKPVSKNNHRTPTLNKPKEVKAPKEVKKPQSNPKNVRKASKNYMTPKKDSPTVNEAPNFKKTDVNKNSETSSQTSTRTTQSEIPKIVKPDPKTVCTCESLKPKEPPAPIVIPRRQEPQNVPKYRWVAVKSEALKTKEEIEAEIRLLLPKTETSTDSKSTTMGRRKPRLCPFCWSNLLKTRQEAERRRERELVVAQQTEKKGKSKAKSKGNEEWKERKGSSNSQINNRFGCLLDDESA